MEQSKDGIVILRKMAVSMRPTGVLLKCSLHRGRNAASHGVGLGPHQHREQLRVMLSLVDEKGEHFETVHRRKDGSLLDVEISTNGLLLGMLN
jgi:hypothetical protein